LVILSRIKSAAQEWLGRDRIHSFLVTRFSKRDKEAREASLPAMFLRAGTWVYPATFKIGDNFLEKRLLNQK
jgi:hypothetical protein